MFLHLIRTSFTFDYLFVLLVFLFPFPHEIRPAQCGEQQGAAADGGVAVVALGIVVGHDGPIVYGHVAFGTHVVVALHDEDLRLRGRGQQQGEG